MKGNTMPSTSVSDQDAVYSRSFTTEDCWVLFSIGFWAAGVKLSSIIGHGDMIGHAIIRRDELEDGLNILIGNRYVSALNGSYYVTRKAIDFYNQYKKPYEGCIIEWIRISHYFVGLPTTEYHKTINITQEDYDSAVDEYINASKKQHKIIAELGKEEVTIKTIARELRDRIFKGKRY